jgi:hypothetical protein
MARVRLTRKFADLIDGIDLSHVKTGEVVDVSPKDARVLVAEGWATPDGPADETSPVDPPKTRHHRRSAKTRGQRS